MKDVFFRADALAEMTIASNSQVMQIGQSGRRLALCAGQRSYRALWTRDLAFGGLGALSLGRADVVVDSVCTLLDVSRDGLVPRRVAASPSRVDALRSVVGQRPRGMTSQSIEFRTWIGTIAMDSNAALLCLLNELSIAGLPAAITDRSAQVREVASWLELRGQGGLRQGPFADWKDLVARRGRVLYTNVLAAQGLRGAGLVLRELGYAALASRCSERSYELANDIQTYWDASRGQFRDWLGDDSGRFSPDGNLLALLYGFADEEQTRGVLGRIDQMRAAQGFPLPATIPSYPVWRKSPLLFLAGVWGYHDAFGWPWLDCVEAMVCARDGDVQRAERVLFDVARASVADGSFYEVYIRDTRPDRARTVRARLYSAEPGFTWSAGLYLRARQMLRDRTLRRDAPAVG